MSQLTDPAAARRALASRLLARRTAADPAAPDPARGRPADGTVPLSFAQERLWFADRLAQDAADYNVPIAMRISGPLDTAALHGALADLMDRHEILRTTYELQDGIPVQRPHPRGELVPDFGELDLSSLSESERRARYRADVIARFELRSDPPLRMRVYGLGSGEHALIVTVHHIASDAWTLGLLFDDLRARYAARTADEDSTLPDLAVQYADYALWQRERLSGDRLEKLLDFWTDTLDGAPRNLSLQTDHARGVRHTASGAFHVELIETPTAQRVVELARTLRTTPFTVLLTLWRISLWHHAGQLDVPVGVPVAGRDARHLDSTAGCFLNMLVSRNELSPDATLCELVTREHHRWLDAVAHQDLPFERLVEALRPDRTSGRTPLFQTTFSHRPALPALPAFAGTSVTELELDGGVAQYDLALDVVGGARGLRTSFAYDANLFNVDTVAGIARRFVNLVEAAVTAPDTPISLLPRNAPGEIEELLRRGEPSPEELATAAEFLAGRGLTLPALFAAAPGDPDAPAVADRHGELSRRRLDAFSSRLANRLRALGVGPGDRVAVLADRRAELPGVLLGVAKTGAAWVPLDPSHPAARLAYILEDCQARAVVLGGAGTVPPQAAHLPLVHLDRDLDALSALPETVPDPPLHPQSTAYLIYTSGSTGRPKGVSISHASLCHYLAAAYARLRAEPEIALIAISTVAFDVAMSELLFPLVSGGRVYVAADWQIRDGRTLAGLVDAWGANALSATPSVWRLLRDSGWPSSPGLTAMSGGEVMPPDLAPWLHAHFKTVWNMYGPTEATIYATMHRLTAQTTAPTVPLGSSLAHAATRILDQRLDLVPPGAVGELCLTGPALAHGYAGRPGLTADRFVPDPFGPPGSRLYRTGDLARWTADGRLAFLGRDDNQVKVRGFRIEPGEVETALTAVPGIAAAVVVGRTDARGDGVLTGYVLAEDGFEFHAEEVRSVLRAGLPDYLVPSQLVRLDAFPVTPAGKIDRAALPEPHAPGGGARPAPAGAAQQLIAAIWSELLGIPDVPADQDFFEAGGHSLSMARLAFRLEEAFDVRIGLAELFERTTVAGQALLVEELIIAELAALDEDTATGLLNAEEC